MWNSKGRSGYGDTNLDGTYDDVVLGVSPNGRQYRNEATLEPRALSGWAYWNLRKQNTPEQEISEELYARNEIESMNHTLANGKANLAKYADPVIVKKTTKVPLKQRILPQSVRVDKLTAEIVELEQAYKTGEFDQDEYSMLRAVAFKRRDRAVELYKKAIKVEEKTEATDEHTHSSETVYKGENSEEIAMFKPQMPSSFAVYVSLCTLGCFLLMYLSH